MTCLWLVVPPGAVWDWFHNDLSVMGLSPWCCVGLIPKWPVCGWSFPLVLCWIDSTMTCLIGRSPSCCVGLIPQWPVCDGSFPLELCGIDSTMTCLWWVVPPGAVWDWFHNDLSVVGRSPWCCVGLIPQWPVCDGSFPLVLCGIDSTMTCLWLVVPPGAVWDWFHNDLSVVGRSPWCCMGLIPQWPVCGWSFPLVLCGIDSTMTCLWLVVPPRAVLDWFHNDLSVVSRSPWCSVGLIPQWPVCGWSFPLVLYGIDSTMTCLWLVVPPGAVLNWFHNDLSVMGRSPWCCVGLIPQWPVCDWSFPLVLCLIDSTMTCLWWVVPPGSVWDWFHNDVSVIGRSPWCCVGLIPQWPVCDGSFPLVLCGIYSTMTCLWLVVPPGSVWDWFHNDLSVIGRSSWCCVRLIPQWPVCDGSFPLVLYGIDSTMTCLWLVFPPGAVWDWFHNDLSVIGRSPWCCVGLIPQWPVCDGSFPLVLYGIDSTMTCLWLVVPPGAVWDWFHNDLSVVGRSPWCCVGLIPQWPVCDWSFPLELCWIDSTMNCLWLVVPPGSVWDWFHNDLSVIGRSPWCCVGLIPQWPVCDGSFPLVLYGIDSTMTCLWLVVPPGAVWDWFHNHLSVIGRSPWCCVGLIPQWPVCDGSFPLVLYGGNSKIKWNFKKNKNLKVELNTVCQWLVDLVYVWSLWNHNNFTICTKTIIPVASQRRWFICATSANDRGIFTMITRPSETINVMYNYEIN